MVTFIEGHRDADKTSTAKELGQFLRFCRRRSIRIHVEHLPRAVHDHSELGHLMGSKQAIKMWSSDKINVSGVRHADWNIKKRAITHSQCRDVGNSGLLDEAGDSGDVRVCCLHSQA